MKKTVSLVMALMISLVVFSQDIEKAFNYFDDEQYWLSAKEFERCLKPLKNLYGKSDTSVYTKVLYYTGASYYMNEQYSSAEKYFLDVKKIYEKRSATSVDFYLYAVNYLGLIYYNDSNQKELIELYDDVLARLKKHSRNKPEGYYKAIKMMREDITYTYNSYPLILLTRELLTVLKAKDEMDYAGYTNELCQLAYFYSIDGDNENALKYYNEAYQIVLDQFSKRDPAYYNVIKNLGLFYEEIDDYENALPLLEESYTILSDSIERNQLEGNKGEIGIDKVMLEYRLNDIYKHLGYLQRVVDYYEKHLEVDQIFGKESDHYIISLFELTMMYEQLNYFEKALVVFDTLANIIYSKPELIKKWEISYLGGRAGLYSNIGKYSEAFELYKEARNIIHKGQITDSVGYSTLLNNVANLYTKVRLYEEALPIFKEAMEISYDLVGPNDEEYVMKLYNDALCLHHLGRYDEALPLYIEAIEKTKTNLGVGHPEYASRLSSLANLYKEMEDFGKAEQMFLESLNASIYALGESNSLSGDIYESLFMLYNKTGQKPEGLNALRKSVSIEYFNMMKTFAFISEQEKEYLSLYLLVDHTIWQSFLLDYAKEDPSVAGDAYNLELMVKGVILQSGIQMQQTILNSGDDEVIAKFNEWINLRTILARQYSIPVNSRAEYLPEIIRHEEQLEAELNRLSNTFKQSQTFGEAKWTDIQERLLENEVAIEFSKFLYLPDDRKTDSICYTAIILRPENEHPQMVYLCEQRQLDSLMNDKGDAKSDYIAGLYRGVQFLNSNMPTSGGRLYDLIWKPLEDYIPDSATVYFAPTGSLHQMAHAAIPVENNLRLCDKYNLVQLTSTAMLLQDEVLRYENIENVTLFGGMQYDMNEEDLLAMTEISSYQSNPDLHRGIPDDIERGGESWAYLPGTLTEVESINNLAVRHNISAISHTGQEALELHYKNLSGVNSPQILHIATHAFYYPEPQKTAENDSLRETALSKKQIFSQSGNPLNRTGLVFSGANYWWQNDTIPKGIDDGILTGWEVTNVTLSNTELVVLSACETGLGDIRFSEGVYGLQRAFKAAGAEYIMMSLWEVPDKETAEFMEYFYSQLFGGGTIIDSFHATQHYMKDQYYGEPEKWAGFVLVR